MQCVDAVERHMQITKSHARDVTARATHGCSDVTVREPEAGFSIRLFLPSTCFLAVKGQ